MKSGKSVLNKLKPYRYTILILLLGIVLMLLPGKQNAVAEDPIELPQENEPAQLEHRLERLLCQIDGAGAVRVLLTLESGAEATYQTDRQRSSKGEEQELTEETVLVSDNGEQKPVVIKTTYPVYKGAVVVCQGADSASVKLNIVRAVSSLTGLGSDKITVVKMKG